MLLMKSIHPSQSQRTYGYAVEICSEAVSVNVLRTVLEDRDQGKRLPRHKQRSEGSGGIKLSQIAVQDLTRANS